RRLQKVDAEIKPKKMWAEGRPRNLPVRSQLVAPAELEWIIEAQFVVEHQPQPNECDRDSRRHQRRPRRSPLTPRMGHRYEQGDRAEQQVWSRPHGQPVRRTRRGQPLPPPLRIM